MKKEKKRSYTNIILIVLVIVLLIGAGYSAYTMVSEQLEEEAEAQAYEDLTTEVIGQQTLVPVGETQDTATYLDIDHAALKIQNKDYAGWIDIPDTKISFPIVYAYNYKVYLYKSFAGKTTKSGTPFMDYRCNTDFSSRNTVIFGHNMMSAKKMFYPLTNYMNDADYVAAHPYIYIYIDNSVYAYRIFSILVTDTSSEAYDVYFSNDDLFTEWVMRLQKASKYDCGADVSAMNNVLTISTCRKGYQNGKRLLVSAMLEKIIQLV